MNLFYKLSLLSILVLLPVLTQLPEDDEIDTAIPGYNHRIYSGTKNHYLRLYGH